MFPRTAIIVVIALAARLRGVLEIHNAAQCESPLTRGLCGGSAVSLCKESSPRRLYCGERGIDHNTLRVAVIPIETCLEKG